MMLGNLRTPDLIVSPVPAPTADQIRFWLRIMKEHSLFIKLGLPCDASELIREADNFYKIFDSLLNRTRTGISRQIIGEIRTAVNNIWVYKRHLLHMMIECNLGGYNYPLLLDHISREAAYFLKLLDKTDLQNPTETKIESIVQENVFWLRIMADHSKFIMGLLDGSERRFVHIANDFSHEFEMLLNQARDLESMLWDFRPINTLRRFEGEVCEATVRIRDFKQQAEVLIKECALLSLIPPLLADHVRREAEHFLEIIGIIEDKIGGIKLENKVQPKRDENLENNTDLD